MQARLVLAAIAAGALLLIGSCSAQPPVPSGDDDDDDNSGTGNGGNSGTGTGGTAGTAPTGGVGGGGPSCAVGQTSCTGVCTTTATDLRHCGMCNNACGIGQGCSAGQCTCTQGLMACATGCANTVSDPANCGACGTVCTAATPFCSQGACSSTCAMGETTCGASCTNTMTDTFNCGFCTNVCAGGQACVNGACGCPQGYVTCAGACVDTTSNASNCGTCGMACGAGQSCVSGACMGGGGGAGGMGGSGGMSGSGPGGAGAGGTGGGPTRPGGCAIAPGLISDFEEGGTMPVVVVQEGRNGEWEKFADTTTGNQMMTVAASGNTGACDAYALHVTGSNYASYAGFGFSLAGPKIAPVVYNATQRNFTGIRFKAKLGSGANMSSPVRFNISTPWTENTANPGGQCTPTTPTATKAKVDCYQHAGRFLPPGSGAQDLTQTWKTFTYCFDRDLYPLSLPSNLTTEQRNNIATSMLKVQFQFNQGKDYSGAYPANAIYPAFAKTLPFDFWVDDISFITGACPNMTASPSNGSPARAFPQNANVGTCAPPAYARNFSSAIADAYARWTRTFVQNDHIVAPEQQNAITSEAMGYGMMIAAAMGDKAAFDRFHTYAKNNGVTANGLMTWKNGGSGSASDGDIDIAYALYMANVQWPSGGYATPASQMAAAILSQDLVNNVIRGGSMFPGAPFNPSYFSPAAFRAFGSSFSTALSTNNNLVNANVSANTNGIPTDWANASNGAPSGAGDAQVTSDIQDGNNGAMGYDAARVPWRLGLGVCTGAGTSAALTAIVNTFAAKYDAGASIDMMKAGWYKTNGNPFCVAPFTSCVAKDMQGSYIGPMGVGAMATGNAAMRDRSFRAMLDILESGDFNHTYFPSTVGLLTLLAMSGNFPTP